MPVDTTLLDSCVIKLGGSNASDDILRAIEEVVVEDDLNLPSIITLRFVDQTLTIIDDPSLAVGTEVEVKLGRGDDNQRVGIGEITALELDQRPGTGRVIVQAFDRGHRLHRGRHVRTFQQMTDADVVNRIASEAGLQSDVDSTSTTHEYLIQDNQSDFAFLSDRALRTGMELTVDDRTVKFKQRNGGGAPAVELAWDSGLIRFSARITAADQVGEVEVRGWDPERKEAITSSVTNSQAAPQIGLDAGQVRSGAFGDATTLVTERPVKDASEAQALAQAALDHATGSIVLADGVALGDPDIRAGAEVKLKGLGQRLSGTYFVTSSVHTVTPTHGYETQFSVRGRRRATLVELSSGNGHDDSRRTAPVVAVVTNVRDPNDQGRVKVKFPWLSDSEESAWARLVSPMAGPTRGLQLVPEVDDEVLVVFEHGDPNHPLVIGGLWNGQDATPLGGDAISGDGAVQQRVLLTRVGHKLLFDDSDASKSIVIEDSAGNKITLDAANKKILVEGQGDIEVKATGTLKLEGQQVEVTASGGNVTVSGTQIKLN
jgi:phage protein D/phage baseplate assembly protein gpV